MSSSASDASDRAGEQRLSGHLEAALEEAENDNLRFHIRQALQFVHGPDD